MKIDLQLFGGGGGSSFGNGRFVETTRPGQREHGHKEYFDNKSKKIFRKDPARGKDPEHWHLENPNRTGNSDYYLDKYGNPVPRHSPEAALSWEELQKLLEIFGR